MNSASETEDDDCLMVMNMYRLARDGGAAKASEFQKLVEETWPGESKERLNRCLKKLAELLARNH